MRFIYIFLLTSFFCCYSLKAKQPNIIVLLADDIGFEEFGSYGILEGKSNTPNFDMMCREGVGFEVAYGQSICGPSRSMFYSGNYAANNGAYDNKIQYLPGNPPKDLDRFPHFVKLLHDHGYQTAVAGKWHNPIGGMLGFDNEILGVDNYLVWYAENDKVEELSGVKFEKDESFWEKRALSDGWILPRYWNPKYIQDGQLIESDMNTYGPDLLCNYITDFIKSNAKSEQPFLAFYPMVLAHGAHCPTPIDVKSGVAPSNKSSKKGTPEGMKYFRNQIHYADQILGKIIETVKEEGLLDNTIIIFSSDNGTTSSAKSKGVEYGVHIPFAAYGGLIKKRGMTSELMDFTDLLPTLVDFGGASIPSKYSVDGKSLYPFLTGKTNKTKDAIFAQPGVCSIVRTKEFLVEAISPQYGYPMGRFYKTNGSFSGKGYENITTNMEYREQRDELENLLNTIARSRLPISFDDPIWSQYIKKGLNHFNNEKRKEKHLSLPKDYQFYDPSFGEMIK